MYLLYVHEFSTNNSFREFRSSWISICEPRRMCVFVNKNHDNDEDDGGSILGFG
jgi:hypothetical protein